MQIHYGKYHSENFECGLCDFEAKSLEHLETHIKTCEVYECEECEKTSTQLTGMKKHILESKKCSLTNILHIKIDRNNDQLANYTAYNQSDL